MLIKSISKAESPTLEVYMAYGKSAEYQEYKLIMQHAVDGLGAPFPLVKWVCRWQPLLRACLSFKPAGKAVTAPRHAWGGSKGDLESIWQSTKSDKVPKPHSSWAELRQVRALHRDSPWSYFTPRRAHISQFKGSICEDKGCNDSI